MISWLGLSSSQDYKTHVKKWALKKYGLKEEDWDEEQEKKYTLEYQTEANEIIYDKKPKDKE